MMRATHYRNRVLILLLFPIRAPRGTSSLIEVALQYAQTRYFRGTFGLFARVSLVAQYRGGSIEIAEGLEWVALPAQPQHEGVCIGRSDI